MGGLLGHRAVGALADATEQARRPPWRLPSGSGMRSGCRGPGARGRPAAGHVQGAAEVDGDVARCGGQVELGQVEPAPHERRLDQRPVRTGDDPQLARVLVGARDRDPDRHRAAPVGVAAEAAVLVPRHIGDAGTMPTGFTSASITLRAAGRLAELVAVAGEPADAGQPSIGEQRGGRGERSWKHCMPHEAVGRRRRSCAHHERPSSGS